MSTLTNFWRTCLTCAFVFLSVFTVHGEEAKSMAFRAGAASDTITPAVGAFIAGDAKNRHFTGIHDDLYAKAAVFDDGSTALALVAVDCIGLTGPDIDKIRAEGARLAGNPRLTAETIIVGSTHTHCGPDVVGIWGPEDAVSGRDEAYMQRLVDTASAQVKRAAEALRPAHLVYGETTAGEDWVVNDCEPNLLDRALVVFQALDQDNKTIFTITNFACHPTILDAVVNDVSADYLYGFYRGMGTLGGEHLFFQGAIGGWIQPNKQTRDFETIDVVGKGVATRALDALKKATPITEPKIRHAGKAIEFPVANPGWKMLSQAGIINRHIDDTAAVRLDWFAIGPAQFATHPGETSPQFGLDTKALMHTQGPKCVLGLTQDALGYILKPSYFDEHTPIPHAEYLTSMSLGPETGPTLLHALQAIIPEH